METTIDAMLDNGDWDSVRACFETHPEMIAEVDPSSGETVLHHLCKLPTSPIDLHETVLKNFPGAVRVQEKTYHATPLHILCWTSQRDSTKVQLLLENMKGSDLLIRDSFGGTALHSACGSQASIETIKLIVRKNLCIIGDMTYGNNMTAVGILWQSQLRSLQGHMQISRILRGEDVTESHFDRFWEKVLFLAEESFYQESLLNSLFFPGHDFALDKTKFAFHGLLYLEAPLDLLKIALHLHPEWAAVPDGDGNYPLHVVLFREPFLVKDKEIMHFLLKAYPEATRKKNKEGDVPLFIAIRNKIGWDEGLKEIVHADAVTLGTRDNETGLYPFLLVSHLGGHVAVDTSYQLLCERPDLVKQAICQFEVA